jgi:exodeoxyribonuclease X
VKVADAIFCVADTETTGLDAATDELLEIGAVLIDSDGNLARDKDPIGNVKDLWEFETLIAPTRPIAPDNSGIHGLIDEDFVGGPSLAYAAARFEDWCPDNAVRVYHNAAFDAGFMPWVKVNGEPILCTKRLAQHLLPTAPNWKNQTLRYYFRDVARRPDIRALGDAHRALSDARVTAAVLPKLLDLYLAQGGVDDIDALITFAESPVLLERVTFGKHKGTLIADVARNDPSYLSWMLRQPDIDPDLRYSIRASLEPSHAG